MAEGVARSIEDQAGRRRPGKDVAKGQARTKQGEESRAQMLQQTEDVTRGQRSRSREVTADQERVEELKVVGGPC